MKRADAVYILAVIVFALAYSALAISNWQQGQSATPRRPFGAPASPSAGKPRDVDVDKLRLLIKGGYLSDREADFYKEAPSVEGRDNEDTLAPRPPDAPETDGAGTQGE